MQERTGKDQLEGRVARDFPLVLSAGSGLFGIQVVWGLQNVSTSRIFQTLGASLADLPILWLAAPIAGLIVQPVVGHYSDLAMTRFGRRRPFIAAGAMATAAGMLLLGFAATLAQAVVGLWLLAASANLAMQPLRALLADLLPAGRRATGYALQVVLIGSGAVLASSLPWLLGHVAGVKTDAADGRLPETIRYAFGIGAAVMLVSALPSLFTREPSIPRKADDERILPLGGPPPSQWKALGWMLLGLAIIPLALALHLRREVYLLAAVAFVYGGSIAVLRARMLSHSAVPGLLRLVADISRMPTPLRRLSVVQFCTWFGLFALWVYAVPAIAARDVLLANGAYNDSADRVGLFFAMFDATAIGAALILPAIVRRLGLAGSHALALAFGSAGLAGLALPSGSGIAWLPAIGVGVAWASILSAPYAIVANSVPADRVGVFLGIQNIFIVIPQLVGATTLGLVVAPLQRSSPMAMVWLAAAAFLIAAAASLALTAKNNAILSG